MATEIRAHGARIWMAAFIVAVLPSAVLADCKAKLAEIDGQLAGVELPPEVQSSVTMMRDGAAQSCEQGAEATAMQQLNVLEMMIPAALAASASAPGVPPTAAVPVAPVADAPAATGSSGQLTADYLAGRWCSMTGEERAELDFSANGTWRPCFPDSMAGGYVCKGQARPNAEWLSTHRNVASIEPDQMTFADSRGRVGQSYRRGSCKAVGR